MVAADEQSPYFVSRNTVACSVGNRLGPSHEYSRLVLEVWFLVGALRIEGSG